MNWRRGSSVALELATWLVPPVALAQTAASPSALSESFSASASDICIHGADAGLSVGADSEQNMIKDQPLYSASSDSVGFGVSGSLHLGLHI